MLQIFARPHHYGDDAGGVDDLRAGIEERETVGAPDAGAWRRERELLEIALGDGAIVAPELGRDALEAVRDRFTRRAADARQRVRHRDVADADDLRDRFRG